MNQKKGFTLIELLVVIAIIGILASIVLVSLGGARSKARDARITAGMNQIRSVAEIVNDTDGDYDNICVGAAPCSTEINTISTDANLQNAAGSTDLTIFRNAASGATAYCGEIQMNTNWWCVDSTLASKSYTTNPSCSSTDFTCD